MGEGPPSFNRDSSCPGLLRIGATPDLPPFAYGALTPYGRAFQLLRLDRAPGARARSPRRHRPPTPQGQRLRPSPPPRFGLLPFRSPLLRESIAFFLFLRVLRCFSSPGPPPVPLEHGMTRVAPGRVPPFGYPRINARLRLPEASRSWPRPSSPACAQASTTCPSSLDTSRPLHFAPPDPLTRPASLLPFPNLRLCGLLSLSLTSPTTFRFQTAILSKHTKLLRIFRPVKITAHHLLTRQRPLR